MFKALPDDKSLYLIAFPHCSQATGEHVVRLEKRKLRWTTTRAQADSHPLGRERSFAL